MRNKVLSRWQEKDLFYYYYFFNKVNKVYNVYKVPVAHSVKKYTKIFIYTYMHTHIYLYIHVYVCVYVCTCFLSICFVLPQGKARIPTAQTRAGTDGLPSLKLIKLALAWHTGT